MKNSQRQFSQSVRWPPRLGPTVGARVTIMPVTTFAVTRRSGGKALKAVANTVGTMAPPTNPCRARQTIIMSMLVDIPASTLMITKPPQLNMNTFWVPHSRAR